MRSSNFENKDKIYPVYPVLLEIIIMYPYSTTKCSIHIGKCNGIDTK